MRRCTRVPAALLLPVVALLASCALLRGDGRHVEPSGFLQDYSQLEPGRRDQAALLYIDPAADFSRYDKILIEPVAIWHRGGGLAEVPPEDAKRLAEHFESELHEELARSFEIVTLPEPGTLWLRTALTGAVGAPHTTDLRPVQRALAKVREMATGTRAFVGRASIEAEILDAMSGERLVAAADVRAGDRAVRDGSGTWSDVEQALDYWARILAARLATFRGFDAAEAAWEEQPAASR